MSNISNGTAPTCVVCAQPASLTCVCKTRYCSVSCQRAHWKNQGHKTECKTLVKANAEAAAKASGDDAGDDAATVEAAPAPVKRRQSMAPKPKEEKKRMSIFEAMQASMAAAAGMGEAEEEVVLECVLLKKSEAKSYMMGMSAGWKKRKFELVKHCRDEAGEDIGPTLRYYDAKGAKFKGAILLDSCEVAALPDKSKKMFIFEIKSRVGAARVWFHVRAHVRACVRTSSRGRARVERWTTSHRDDPSSPGEEI